MLCVCIMLVLSLLPVYASAESDNELPIAGEDPTEGTPPTDPEDSTNPDDGDAAGENDAPGNGDASDNDSSSSDGLGSNELPIISFGETETASPSATLSPTADPTGATETPESTEKPEDTEAGASNSPKPAIPIEDSTEAAATEQASGDRETVTEASPEHNNRTALIVGIASAAVVALAAVGFVLWKKTAK